MTARRKGLGIESMLEFGLQLLQPVQALLAHASGNEASKRRPTMYLRPCLETLEDRTLLSITASLDVQARAQDSFNGQGQTSESTSNPGTATATWQDSAGTDTATSTGSYQLNQSSLTESANMSADYQSNPGALPVLGAWGSVTISGSIVALAPETVNLGFEFQFTHSSDAGAVGDVSILLGSGTGVSNSLLQFEIGAVDYGDLDTDSGQQFSYAFGVPAGTYSFQANITAVAQNFDPGPTGPMSANFGFTISEVPQTSDTTTSLVSAPNPSLYGQAATFTANVTPTTTGLPAPTGTVNFMDGSNVIGTGTLDASGQATFSTSSLAIGNHDITAQYVGDSYNNGSTSSPVTETVSQIGTTTTLGSSSDPSNYGQPITFTATVTPASSGPAAPSGTITFMDGASPLGSAPLDGTGMATFQTSMLAVGDHPSITAVYSGDNDFIGSTSAAIDQLVLDQQTSPSLTITIPSGQTNFFIIATPNPAMPTIVADVLINGSKQDAATTQFQWTAQIDYSKGSIQTTGMFTSTVTGGSVTFDHKIWKGQFRGGELTLTVTATVDGQQVSATLTGLTISGDNPDPQSVLDYLANKKAPLTWPSETSYNYGKVLEAIAEQETLPNQKLQQFNSDGTPIIAPDDGVGIMQITPPSGQNIKDPNQVWNWKANLNGGAAIFNSKLSDAEKYVARLQNAVNKKGTLLNKAVLAAEKADGYSGLTITIPPMTPDQIVLNAIRGYNGYAGDDGYGKHLREFELATDSNGYLLFSNVNLTKHTATLSWVEVPAEDRPSSPGNPDYVEDVLGWYDQI